MSSVAPLVVEVLESRTSCRNDATKQTSDALVPKDHLFKRLHEDGPPVVHARRILIFGRTTIQMFHLRFPRLAFCLFGTWDAASRCIAQHRRDHLVLVASPPRTTLRSFFGTCRRNGPDRWRPLRQRRQSVVSRGHFRLRVLRRPNVRPPSAWLLVLPHRESRHTASLLHLNPP